MVWYEFYFEQESPGKKPFYLSLWLVSDTGYFAGKDPVAERTDLDAFASPEASSTKLAFILYDEKAEYDPIYEITAESKEEIRRFVEEGAMPELFTRTKVFAKCYDFARLADERSTDAVIDDVIRSAKPRGFSIARVSKAA